MNWIINAIVAVLLGTAVVTAAVTHAPSQGIVQWIIVMPYTDADGQPDRIKLRGVEFATEDACKAFMETDEHFKQITLQQQFKMLMRGELPEDPVCIEDEGNPA